MAPTQDIPLSEVPAENGEAADPADRIDSGSDVVDRAVTRNGDNLTAPPVTNIGKGDDIASSNQNPSAQEKRVIFINRPQPIDFRSNQISTAKYNVVTFLPMFLFEQFRRYSNCFFLMIALLQQIPDVSPTGRYTTIFPFGFILAVSALKEIFEDWKRHRADGETNHRHVEVLRGTEWQKILWRNLKVGDLCKINNNEQFPADLVLLSSSEPQGMCFIETSNLDGETNLKIRQALPETSHRITKAQLLDLNGTVHCEPPNRLLYEFNGVLKETNKQDVPLKLEQMLLRGAMLRNTSWVFALVIYTGNDSKLMMNSTKAPLKRSSIDRDTNTQILMLFFLLVGLALLSALFTAIWTRKHTKTDWYLDLKESHNTGFVFNFTTFFILYNNLIPISLQVTAEIVRFMQAKFIALDMNMYHAETDTPANARTSNLNEELGMVKYIFSDKTGTLTCNIMEFKKCSIAEKIFNAVEPGEDLSRSQLWKSVDSDPLASATTIRKKRKTSIRGRSGSTMGGTSSASGSTSPQGSSSRQGGSLSSQVSSGKVGQMRREAVLPRDIDEFLTMLAVCHTVIPERIGDTLHYHAASPDERALVEGGASFGYVFDTRTPTGLEYTVRGKRKYMTVLHVIDFTSTRKRMSIIVKTPENKIKIYCKGADTVIFPRLASNGRKYEEVTLNHLEEFAIEGYRTLVFAWADIKKPQYNEWYEIYQKASVALENREEKIEQAAELIEKDLILLGATAIEDKLQDGVPETIAKMLEANIHVWVLTGDKTETAINIAYSAKLIKHGEPIIILSEGSLDATREAISRHLAELGPNVNKENNIALVVDGQTLKYASSYDLSKDFLDLCLACHVVVCCRVSPLQKAEMVDLVSKRTKAVTLAIGDGANDVAMIQRASIGVGISGMEGLQAVCASDYSIAQFRFLQSLLLVHGAWNYMRISKLILYSFYKNITLYVIELWFAIYSAWSGQVLFERWTISMYNVIFTALPPFAIGLFDKVCSAEVMLKNPRLYIPSQAGLLFNVRVFWLWMINAIAHSILLFWLTMLAAHHQVVWSSGKDGGYLLLGNFVYTYVVVTVCVKAGLEIQTWTIVTHVALWGSIAMWFVFLLVYSNLYPILPMGEHMLGMDRMVFSSTAFYVGLILIPFFCLIPDILLTIINNSLWPSVSERARVAEIRRQPDQVLDATTKQHSLAETARLLKNVRSVFTRRSETMENLEIELSHGFAFSQEEGGTVSQGDIIRAYDTNRPKPAGS